MTTPQGFELKESFKQSLKTTAKKVFPKSSHHILKRIVNGPRMSEIFPLLPSLRLPSGWSEFELATFLESLEFENQGSAEEIRNYCRSDFRRFLYTLDLAHGLSGSCLELGANPYFTTILLKFFSSLELTFSNYFGAHLPTGPSSQTIEIKNPKSLHREKIIFNFDHFNVEQDRFPYEDSSFDVVLFCEIIEHLPFDPLHALREIKRVLKPNGTVILTTPNEARLENVARMIRGQNIYDPYSGYGVYGRHNREFTQNELSQLLKHLGFTVDRMFTADVHENRAGNLGVSANTLRKLVKFRENDLGQYVFLSARSTGPAHEKKPSNFYRSYPSDQLD